MEDDNFYFLWSHALIRKIGIEIGRRLKLAGVLDSAEDVVFLYRDQMERALVDLAAGVYDLSPFTALARAQKARWEEWSRLQPPSYIGDFPDEIEDVMVNHFWGIRGRTTSGANGDGDKGTRRFGGMRGRPSSPREGTAGFRENSTWRNHDLRRDEPSLDSGFH